MQFPRTVESQAPGICTFIQKGHARTASEESAALAAAAKRAMGGLQWKLAAHLYEQAADVLPKAPNKGPETIQAQGYRRSARQCHSMANTRVPRQLIKDNPDYMRSIREEQAKDDLEWIGWGTA